MQEDECAEQMLEGWPSELPSELMREQVTARVSQVEKKLFKRVQIAEVAAAQTKMRFKNRRGEKNIKFIDEDTVGVPSKHGGSESGPLEGAKLGGMAINEPKKPNGLWEGRKQAVPRIIIPKISPVRLDTS
jgi:hypothetical protein